MHVLSLGQCGMSLSARIWAESLTHRPLLPDESALNGGIMRRLTPAEKWILVALTGYESVKHGYAFPSYKELAEKTLYSLATVKRTVKTLEEYGLIEIRKSKRSGRYLSNSYYFPHVGIEDRAKDKSWMAARSIHGGVTDIRSHIGYHADERESTATF